MNDCPTASAELPMPKIGDAAPDFTAATTVGEITFSQWATGSWVVLFSHPADFTPVCSTEMIEFARREPEFAKRGVKLIGLSIDSVHSHLAWRENLRERLKVEIQYPLIADLSMEVSRKFGMLHARASTTSTVRAAFIIDAKRMVRAIIYYPMNVGRNIDELMRVVDALQCADKNGVACPVNWRPGEKVLVPPPKNIKEVADRRSGAYDEVIDFYLVKKSL